ETDARAGGDVFLHHVGRRVEEDDGVLERDQNECDRHTEYGAARADEQQPALAPCHLDPSTPATLPPGASSPTPASTRRSLSGSPPRARRAPAAAPSARSCSPSPR